MSAVRQRKPAQRKRRVLRRIRHQQGDIRDEPMLSASNIHYELTDRVQGLGIGGIGAIHLLARRTGLIELIDQRLHLLKPHHPYHESDHVLNIPYNALCGGGRLEDIELRRNDEVYLDALGAERIPDPTTAGDFCRRFDQVDVHTLMETTNEVRVKGWKQQPERLMDNLLSNWAYTVMASLAWALEVWFALILPETCRWKAKHRDEKRSVLRIQFKTFLNAFTRVPCQIV